MNIIFFGTPKEVIPVLKSLVTHFDVVAVVTTPDQKSGRKQQLTPTPIKTWANEHLIDVLTPHTFDAETIEQIKKYQADLFIVAAYGQIIPNDILSIPSHGAINIHPSLLPKYRGPTPIQTALINGDRDSGVTFIKMDEKMDHGPILHQIPFKLETSDTFAWLMQSKFAQAAQVLPRIVEDYVTRKINPIPQDDSSATYTKLLTKEDGHIDLTHPPKKEEFNHMVHAYYPWPTVWTKTILKDREMIIKFLPDNKIQVEGKNPVSYKDFLNGYPEMKEILENLFNK
ncbi:MAG TPA: methionyl-tRNA formyltransferase [Candidatus Saccharimonadales bacterium]|nr:methionyl-tRNA formyltransferase [Candidatus Saccharimonadales bacterium]